MREENLLTSYLADLDQRNWDIDQYLAERTDLPETVQGMLRAAARLHAAPRPVPSGAFRHRSSQRLAAAMAVHRIEASTARRAKFLVFTRWSRPRLRALALPTAAALVLMVGFSGAWTASAAALPGTPFYPAKLTAEQVQVLLATTPEQQAQVQLQIATTRLAEAEAEASNGNQTVVPTLLNRYQQAIAKAQAEAANIPSSDSRQQIMREISILNAADHKITPRVTDKSNSSARPTPQTKVASAGPSHVSTTSSGLAPTNQDAVEATASPIRVMATAPAKNESKPLVVATKVATSPASTTTTKDASTMSTNKEPIANPSLKVLVAAALSGNDSSATAAALAYIKQIQTNQGHAVTGSDLQTQRAQLEHALQSAPTATRHAILLAIAALDSVSKSGSTANAVAASPSETSPSTDHAVVAKPGNHQALPTSGDSNGSSGAPASTSNGGTSSDQSGKPTSSQNNNRDHPGGSVGAHLGKVGNGANHRDGSTSSSTPARQSKAGPDSGHGGSQPGASGSNHLQSGTGDASAPATAGAHRGGSASSNSSSSVKNGNHPLIQVVRSVIKRSSQHDLGTPHSPANSSSSANQPKQ
ncbi:MAG: DUF5667 domain-containing protein [Chloroflexi bacterium]|nr:DUF5667 domain-containing protein [Chloroflexota bacterium]